MNEEDRARGQKQVKLLQSTVAGMSSQLDLLKDQLDIMKKQLKGLEESLSSATPPIDCLTSDHEEQTKISPIWFTENPGPGREEFMKRGLMEDRAEELRLEIGPGKHGGPLSEARELAKQSMQHEFSADKTRR